jgi:magnesium transporter
VTFYRPRGEEVRALLNVFKNDRSVFQTLEIEDLDRNCWISLVRPTEQELARVADLTGAPMDFFRAALDEEERSRIEVEDDFALVLVNIPLMTNETNYDTLPLGIVITPDLIITVCLEENPVFTEFNDYTRRSFNTAKRTRFLFQILLKAATFYLRYIRQISRANERIEKDLRRFMHNKGIFELMDLQQSLTYFSASVRSNGVVLDRLLRLRSSAHTAHILPVYEEDEDLLEDVIIENSQATQMVEMYSRILAAMMETFASIISNNLNMVMKFLTAMTIILAIPTMIASFWGMNVIVPFGERTPYGFLIVIGICVFLTGITAFYLIRRKIL